MTLPSKVYFSAKNIVLPLEGSAWGLVVHGVSEWNNGRLF